MAAPFYKQQLILECPFHNASNNFNGEVFD